MQVQGNVLAWLGYFFLSTEAVDKAVENSKTTLITVSPVYAFAALLILYAQHNQRKNNMLRAIKGAFRDFP